MSRIYTPPTTSWKKPEKDGSTSSLPPPFVDSEDEAPTTKDDAPIVEYKPAEVPEEKVSAPTTVKPSAIRSEVQGLTARKSIEDIVSEQLHQINEKLVRLRTVCEKKFNELEERIANEEANRLKLAKWIKDNIGPSLERVREVVKEEVAQSMSHYKVPKSMQVAAAPAAVLPQKSRRNSAADHEPAVPHSHHAPQSVSHAPKHVPAPEPKFDEDWSDNETIEDIVGPTVRPRRITRNPKLAQLEASAFGVEDIEERQLPADDASKKGTLARANYFLNTQQQATTLYRCPTMFDRAKSFLEKGGQLIFVPAAETDRKKDNFVFGIKTFDNLFPVCPDGLNRSQILYLVLMGIKRVLGVNEGLNLPHGARSGFDPFPIKDDPTDESQHFLHIPGKGEKARATAKAYAEAFGVDKAARFGESEAGTAELSFTPKREYMDPEKVQIQKNRTRLREFFDLYYYGQRPKKHTDKGRTIYLVFGSALPVVIDRIVEANFRQDVSRPIILAIPFGVDKAFVDASATEMKNLYKLYASIFKPIAE